MKTTLILFLFFTILTNPKAGEGSSAGKLSALGQTQNEINAIFDNLFRTAPPDSRVIKVVKLDEEKNYYIVELYHNDECFSRGYLLSREKDLKTGEWFDLAKWDKLSNHKCE
jgi:hypothetical protein